MYECKSQEGVHKDSKPSKSCILVKRPAAAVSTLATYRRNAFVSLSPSSRALSISLTETTSNWVKTYDGIKFITSTKSSWVSGWDSGVMKYLSEACKATWNSDRRWCTPTHDCWTCAVQCMGQTHVRQDGSKLVRLSICRCALGCTWQVSRAGGCCGASWSCHTTTVSSQAWSNVKEFEPLHVPKRVELRLKVGLCIFLDYISKFKAELLDL